MTAVANNGMGPDAAKGRLFTRVTNHLTWILRRLNSPVPYTAFVHFDRRRFCLPWLVRVRHSKNLAELLGKPKGWHPERLLDLVGGASTVRQSDDRVRQFVDSPFMLLDEETGLIELTFFLPETRCWINMQVHPIINRREDLTGFKVTIQKTKGPDRPQKDDLTQLLNRPTFMRLAEYSLHHDTGLDRLVCLFMLDLNYFKRVNDTHGHRAGDHLLIKVAKVLQSLAASYGGQVYVARFGGDEFALLGAGLDERKVRELAEKCLKKTTFMEDVPDLLGDTEPVLVKASIGIAYTNRYLPFDELYRQADLALDYVKKNSSIKSGRSLCFYEESLGQKARAELSVPGRARQALEAQEISPHYEPIISRMGQVSRVEALSQLLPTRGIAQSPSAYLGGVKELGQLLEHEFQILHQAARDVVDIQNQTGQPLILHINLIPEALSEPDLLEMVTTALNTTGLSPACLCIEVTEGPGLPPFREISDVMKKLRHLGITLALDDYGTEFASPARLIQLPLFSSVKFASELVEYLSDEPADDPVNEEQRRNAWSVVGEEIRKLHRLGQDVIAEHIDTAARLRSVLALEVDYMQGHLLSGQLASGRRLRKDDIIHLIRQSHEILDLIDLPIRSRTA